MTSGTEQGHPCTAVTKTQKNKIAFNAAGYLYQVLGTDVTQICGIKEITALTIFRNRC